LDQLDKLEKKLKKRKSGDKSINADDDLADIFSDDEDFDKFSEEFLDFDFEDYAKEHHLDSIEDVQRDAKKYQLKTKNMPVKVYMLVLNSGS